MFFNHFFVCTFQYLGWNKLLVMTTMTVSLWFAAMVMAVGASPDQKLSFRRDNNRDTAVQTPKTVGCTNAMDNERNQFIEKAGCTLREVYLGLAPPAKNFADPRCGNTGYYIRSDYRGYFSFEVDPSYLWVKRCIGNCDFADQDTNCRPQKIVRRKLPITLYNVNTDKYHCSTFVLEEHEACSCVNADSTCQPQDFNVDIDSPGGDQGKALISRCTGNCSEFFSTCMPHSVLPIDIITDKGSYKAESHQSCQCGAHVFLGSCRPIAYYPLGPFFATKICKGVCVGEHFNCVPIKTKTVDVPNSTQTWVEHSECACAKLQI